MPQPDFRETERQTHTVFEQSITYFTGGSGEISQLPPTPLSDGALSRSSSSPDDVINAASIELAGLGVPSHFLTPSGTHSIRLTQM